MAGGALFQYGREALFLFITRVGQPKMEMLAKYIVLGFAGLLTFLWFWPLKVVGAYLITRPLIQPLANMHVVLSGIPIAAPISLSMIIGTFAAAYRVGPRSLSEK